MSSVRVVIKLPGQPATIRTIEDSLESLQRIVGGSIEMIPFESAPGTDLIFNEEGRIEELPINVNLPMMGTILGTLIVARYDMSGDMKSLSLAEAKSIATILTAFSDGDPWRVNPIRISHPLYDELVWYEEALEGHGCDAPAPRKRVVYRTSRGRPTLPEDI